MPPLPLIPTAFDNNLDVLAAYDDDEDDFFFFVVDGGGMMEVHTIVIVGRIVVVGRGAPGLVVDGV